MENSPFRLDSPVRLSPIGCPILFVVPNAKLLGGMIESDREVIIPF